MARTINTPLLRKAVPYLQSQGVDLQANDETRNAVIGLCIMTLVDAGQTIDAATDCILGAGTFQTIADNVWGLNNA